MNFTSTWTSLRVEINLDDSRSRVLGDNSKRRALYTGSDDMTVLCSFLSCAEFIIVELDGLLLPTLDVINIFSMNFLVSMTNCAIFRPCLAAIFLTTPSTLAIQTSSRSEMRFTEDVKGQIRYLFQKEKKAKNQNVSASRIFFITKGYS